MEILTTEMDELPRRGVEGLPREMDELTKSEMEGLVRRGVKS